MPSSSAHLAAVKKNHATIDFLLTSDDHLAWVVAVAFYKALHMVEACFDADAKCPIDHTDDHKHRHNHLKQDRRYAHIWKSYRPLYQASLIARYLREDPKSSTHEVFEDYMPRQVIEKTVLGHYLVQIEKSIAKLLADPHFFS